METLDILGSEGGTGSAPRRYYPKDPSPAELSSGYAPRESSQSGTFPYPGEGRDLRLDSRHDARSRTYVEVFGGGAGVLYQKPRSKYEIYNDADKDLAQFFTVLRDRPDDPSGVAPVSPIFTVSV